MTLRVHIEWLMAALLLSLRVAAATTLAPVFGPTQIPAVARVVVSLGLAGLIFAALPTAPAPIASLGHLGTAAAVELVIGASLSFGFLAAYAATQVSGRALDIQIGFGVASVLNPGTQRFAPLVGTVLGMAFVAVFLAMDGHHVLVQALAMSAQRVPPGSVVYSPDWESIVRHSGVMFTFGAAFAAPVMMALLLADLAMAVLARSMPLMNVFVLSFSVKVVLGLTALAFSVRLAGPLLAALFDTTYRFWEGAAGLQ